MMWPLEAITEKLRPRNLFRVRDFAGDSTMTSDLPAAREATGFDFAAFRVLLGFSAFSAFADLARLGRAAFFAAAVSVSAEGVDSAFSATGSRARGLRAARSVRDVAFANRILHGSIVARERHAHRHLMRHLDAHRTPAAGGQPVEHALHLPRVERTASLEIQQIAPRFGAQPPALLLAQHTLRLPAGRVAGNLGARAAAAGEAAQGEHRRLHLIRGEVGGLERRPEGFERQLVAFEEVVEMPRHQTQHALHRLAISLVAHVLLPTPSSMGMWHFLYFLPLPHGHGSFRPTRGPVLTGVGAAVGVAGPAAGRSVSPLVAIPPPNASAASCRSTMRRGAGRRSIGCCPSGTS